MAKRKSTNPNQKNNDHWDSRVRNQSEAQRAKAASEAESHFREVLEKLRKLNDELQDIEPDALNISRHRMRVREQIKLLEYCTRELKRAKSNAIRAYPPSKLTDFDALNHPKRDDPLKHSRPISPTGRSKDSAHHSNKHK